MNRIKIIFFVFINLFYFSGNLKAQTEFDLPAGLELKTKEDFANYDTLVVQAADWLVNNRMDKQKGNRKEVNKFVAEWITGSPTVSMVFYAPLLKLFDNNPNLLAIYIANYCKYCIVNKSDKEVGEAAKAALLAVNTVYTKGVGVEKSKELDKLNKAVTGNTLEKFIQKLMK